MTTKIDRRFNWLFGDVGRYFCPFTNGECKMMDCVAWRMFKDDTNTGRCLLVPKIEEDGGFRDEKN
jgi:hypothetical protein